jgi:tetratricopeptide (TPR) repeat protein
MRWSDIQSPAKVPLDVYLVLQRESAARRPQDAGRHAQLGGILLQLAKYGEAAAAFEQAERLRPSDFRHFVDLAECYLSLGRPDAALRVCERGNEIIPNCSKLHDSCGVALQKLNRSAEAHQAFLNAVASSRHAFAAAESLLSPLASNSDGSRLLALCDELPEAYANCTVVRGFRAIGLSRVGRKDEARKLVDLVRHVAQITFEPPEEFGSIERFNARLAHEILRNPGLRRTPTYSFDHTEHLNISGAFAFPVLAKFLRAAIEAYITDFPRRGLDVILPPVPSEGFLVSAGNVVREEERQSSHLHKFGYVSGVYHVSVPPNARVADDRAGALVLGSCDDRTGGYAPCWGSRDIKPVPGVATLFPSHIFHSVVSTRSVQPRIAVPFDLWGVQVVEESRRDVDL